MLSHDVVRGSIGRRGAYHHHLAPLGVRVVCSSFMPVCPTLVPVGHSAPRLPNKDVSRTTLVEAGAGFSVFCDAQGHPTPAFRYAPRYAIKVIKVKEEQNPIV